MIPIGPLVWIAILLFRALRDRGQADAGGRRPASTLADAVHARAVVLVFLHATAWAWLVAAFGLFVQYAFARFDHDATLPFAASLLVTVGGPALALYHGPRWLAWRVLRPLRLGRAAQVVLWFAPFLSGADVRGLGRLIRTSLGRPAAAPRAPWARLTFKSRPRPPDGSPAPADAWTTCALALEATRQGDRPRLERLAAALSDLPRRVRLPRLLRVYAFEALAAEAARRGEWDAVEGWARLGRGRGARLWRLLAAARRRRDAPSAALLWAAWLASAQRRLTLVWVREALAPRGAADAGDGTLTPPPRAVAARHVELLGRVAAGRPVDAPDVLRLIDAWDALLGGAAESRLRARALELEAHDADLAWAGLYERVTAELGLLFDAAGATLAEVEGRGRLGALLGAGLRARLFDTLRECTAPWNDGSRHESDTPVEEWERWLVLREAVTRLDRRGGDGALETAWHDGLRLAAWNLPCRLFNAHGADAAWAAQVMFEWTVSLAARVGDAEALRVNTGNARQAARTIP